MKKEKTLLFIHKEYNGSFVLDEPNFNKDEVFDNDYFELEKLPNNITIEELYNLAQKKYNCKKLIFDF